MAQHTDKGPLPLATVSDEKSRQKAQAALSALRAKEGMDLVEMLGLDRFDNKENNE